MKKSLLILLCITFSSSSFSLDEESALSNFSSELSKCSAYYTLMAYQFESQNMDASSFKQSGEFAYMLAAKASNDKVTQARIELDVKAMMKEIDNNWSNGAILINKYGESCKEIIENPEGRLEYWLSKP